MTGVQLDPSREIGANEFAYPFAYPKRMTDWGGYAKNSALAQGLTTLSLHGRERERVIVKSANGVVVT